jgi:hypothetical protein
VALKTPQAPDMADSAKAMRLPYDGPSRWSYFSFQPAL